MTEKTLAEQFNIPCPERIDPSHTIVLVEDQQDMRIIIASHLNKMGFKKIQQLANGHDALQFIKETKDKISLIVSDIDMPVMNGFELLIEIRENPQIERPPFAIAMDNPSKEKIMFALESGVDEILVKPFTLNDIFPKIQSAFKKYHNPKNPEKVYELAKQLLRQEKLLESEKVYTVIANDTKNAARPWVGLAHVAMKQKKYDDALKNLKEAENRNPNYVHLFSLRGKVYVEQKKTAEAIEEFKKAITLSPLNPIRYEDAASPLFEMTRYKEGIDVLNLALAQNLNFPSLYHFLSQGNFMLKDYQAAIKHIRTALAGEPQNVTYLNQLGIALKEVKDFDGAMQTYNSIIKIDPDNRAALYNKAVLQNSMGDKADAIKTLTRLLSKHPDFAPAKAKLDEYQSGKAA